jgi:hypothetical protein
LHRHQQGLIRRLRDAVVQNVVVPPEPLEVGGSAVGEERRFGAERGGDGGVHAPGGEGRRFGLQRPPHREDLEEVVHREPADDHRTVGEPLDETLAFEATERGPQGRSRHTDQTGDPAFGQHAPLGQQTFDDAGAKFLVGTLGKALAIGIGGERNRRGR